MFTKGSLQRYAETLPAEDAVPFTRAIQQMRFFKTPGTTVDKCFYDEVTGACATMGVREAIVQVFITRCEEFVTPEELASFGEIRFEDAEEFDRAVDNAMSSADIQSN